MPAVRLNDKMYNLLKTEAERADCTMSLILELALRQLFSDGVKAGTARQLIEDSYNNAIGRLTRKPDPIQTIISKEPDEVEDLIDTYVARNLDIDPLPKIPAPIPDPIQGADHDDISDILGVL